MRRALIGFGMRTYRRSPLYPRMGRHLARLMAIDRHPNNEPFLHEIDGVTFEIDLREVIDASLYYSGTFESEAEAIITDLLEPGMVAIVIGANFGYHTFRMSRGFGFNGQVLAIEPTTWAYDKLLRNAKLNGMTNISYAKFGLSDVDSGDTEIAFVSSYPLSGESTSTVETVRLTTLDTLCQRAGSDPCRLHKAGRRRVRGESAPRLCADVAEAPSCPLLRDLTIGHGMNGAGAFELIGWLSDLGYRFEDEDRHHIADMGAYLRGIADGTSVNLLAVAAPGRLPR